MPDEDLDDNTLDDDTLEDDLPPDDEEYVPPTKAEMARIRKALDRYKGHANSAQTKLNEYRKANGIPQPGGGPKPAPPKPTGDPAADAAALAAQAMVQQQLADTTAEATRWRRAALTQASVAAIFEAGFTGNKSAAAKLAKLVDQDCEPDDDGTFDLEDQIDELKESYGALFGVKGAGGGRPSAGNRRFPAANTSNPGRESSKPADPDDEMTKALMRQLR